MMTTQHADLRSASRQAAYERRAGVTMVQTAALIALIGSLIAIAVPAFQRTVRKSKVAEASTELERMHQAIVAYYSASGRTLTHCLPDAAGPTPETPSIDPLATTFGESVSASTWNALKFEPLGPVRFSYSFTPNNSGCDLKAHGDIAVLRADGDLDGDGRRSHFERHLVVTREHDIVPDVLIVRDRIE